MKTVKNASAYLIGIMATIFAIIPFLWMISTSLKPQNEIFKFPPEWIPSNVTLQSFHRVWETMPFDRYLLNTFIVTGTILAGTLIFASIAAYSFARLRYPGRDKLFFLLLASMMIPKIVTMIPIYIMMKQFGLIDTYAAIILPSLFAEAYEVFLLRQFFITIPGEMEESAKIDGAGVVRTFLTIIVPISKPIFATLTVLTVVKQWNNFLWPLIVTSSETKYLLSIGLANLNGQNTSDWAGIMAASFIALIPILAIFAVAQKYFVESIQLTGLK
ncbi:carbohydrate ABC transporter permease [Paenibacillus frigoriresistens]|uniref:carbohydrate ABC transporter permease n=1 Tax=Paenibacillus alginolyticus TaxID=59839 RepID=UPI001567561C|nr:carbohydrate ABC transporter permease [Paenibacillus frigoriresistens]NRF90373.1 carbohydrate ABC transporter permease [Paenibacillus frigoriresistens]